jgi:hypothetical protein
MYKLSNSWVDIVHIDLLSQQPPKKYNWSPVFVEWRIYANLGKI